MAVGYVIAGWALAQGIAQVFPVFDISNWAIRLTVVLIALGFPVALIVAWLFDLTPQGIKRTDNVETAAVRDRPVGKFEFSAIIITVVLLAIGMVGYEHLLFNARPIFALTDPKLTWHAERIFIMHFEIRKAR